MSYYVYILTNQSNDVLYTGVTNDLQRRVYEHKTHIDPKAFTTRYNIDKLVCFEIFSVPQEAIDREKQIKSWNRRKKNQLIENQNPEWRDLYDNFIG